MAGTRPISHTEFAKSLLRVTKTTLPPSNRTQLQHEPLKIGVCVSGGADSMTLAYFLHNMRHQQHQQSRLFSAHAFIVDHGIRDESADEAAKVQEYLMSFGILSRILKLDLGAYTDAKQMRGFEGIARRARYQEIASAALQENIFHLFTGHHHDDQMETLMLRIVKNNPVNILGLQGMAGNTVVPCCERIPGAHGYTIPKTIPKLLKQNARRLVFPQSVINVSEDQPHEGIQLVRPLLDYSKDRILATCKHFEIPYVQDRTNFDRTLTVRNTIRYLRSNFALPKALRDEQLEELKGCAQTITQNIESDARVFCDRVTSFQLHSHTGIVKLSVRRFSQSPTSAELRGLSYTMARLLDLVAPSKPEHGSMMLEREVIFQLLHSGFQSIPSKLNRLVVNHAMIDFLRTAESDNGEQHILIRPQPMRDTEIIDNTTAFVPTTQPYHERHCSSEWVLWNSRFWFRINSPNRKVISDVSIRPFRPEDVRNIQKTLKRSGNLQAFKDILTQSAPDVTRFTLPVLCHRGEIFSFPTLGFEFDKEFLVEVETRYHRSLKTLDFLYPRKHTAVDGVEGEQRYSTR